MEAIKTNNEKALAIREDFKSLTAGIKAGAIPEVQGRYAKRAIMRKESALPFIIRKSLDAAIRDICGLHQDGAECRVGMHIESGLHYAWLARGEWEPCGADGVELSDPDELGLDSAFVNIIKVYAK